MRESKQVINSEEPQVPPCSDRFIRKLCGMVDTREPQRRGLSLVSMGQDESMRLGDPRE